MAQTEQALYRKGAYATKQITSSDAGGALTAGDVIVIGDLACVIHNAYSSDDHSDGKVAEVAIGGGVYDVLKSTASGSALATVGTKVYWDDSSNVVTTTASSNKVFGRTVQTATSGAAFVRCQHDPGA